MTAAKNKTPDAAFFLFKWANWKPYWKGHNEDQSAINSTGVSGVFFLFVENFNTTLVR